MNKICETCGWPTEVCCKQLAIEKVVNIFCDYLNISGFGRKKLLKALEDDPYRDYIANLIREPKQLDETNCVNCKHTIAKGKAGWFHAENYGAVGCDAWLKEVYDEETKEYLQVHCVCKKPEPK